MNDIGASAIVIPSVSPETIRLNQRLQRYYYELSFSGEHQGMMLKLESSPVEATLSESHIVLETDYGCCALDNYPTVFQALLGIPFAKLEREDLVRKLNIFLPSAPQELANLLGCVTPNAHAKSNPSDYLLCATLFTADCSMSFNITANETFWQRLLSHPCISQRRITNEAARESCSSIQVTLGGVRVGKKALSNLKNGDVLLLDNCLFDQFGHGVIQLRTDTLIVQWQSRGVIDKFLVINREARHAN